MGIGDEIMVTGEIKRRAAGTARRFVIRDARKPGLYRWDDIWRGNPRIAAPGEEFDEEYFNHPGARPYIAKKGWHRWDWHEYTPEPGELFLTPEELAFGQRTRGAIVVQPAIKPSASTNKLWPHENWWRIVAGNQQERWVQLGEGWEQRIPGAEFIQTPTFRHACGALTGARAALLHEGGLHHAAAALSIPALVLFGGFISPRCTGYTTQRNLFHDHVDFPLGCGMRQHCGHCARAWENLDVKRVNKELKAFLQQLTEAAHG